MHFRIQSHLAIFISKSLISYSNPYLNTALLAEALLMMLFVTLLGMLYNMTNMLDTILWIIGEHKFS